MCSVEHERQSATAEQVTILYKVLLGPRRRVERVSVEGNRYFDAATLKQLLSVHAADTLDRHGAYSQALVSADINALQAVYQNNGFSKVKVTSETNAGETASGGRETSAGTPSHRGSKTTPLTVVYRVEEGEQLRVGTVRIEGNEHVDAGQTHAANEHCRRTTALPRESGRGPGRPVDRLPEPGLRPGSRGGGPAAGKGRFKQGGCGLSHH